jgi:hypothetical protein
VEVSGQIHTLSKPRGQNPRYPWYRRLVGPESWPGQRREQIFFLLYRNSNSYPSVSLPVANRYTTCPIAAPSVRHVKPERHLRPDAFITHGNLQEPVGIARYHPSSNRLSPEYETSIGSYSYLTKVSPSWEAATCAAIQEFRNILCNPKTHCRSQALIFGHIKIYLRTFS